MWESRTPAATHPERGFLPEPDPLRELPAGFAAWEERAFELGRLIVAGRVRRAIEWMPLLDPGALADGPDLRRAMLLLSFLGHAYVWGGRSPAARARKIAYCTREIADEKCPGLRMARIPA